MIRWLVIAVVLAFSSAAAAQFFPLGLKIMSAASSKVCEPVQKAFKPVVISKTPPVGVC